ncbi:MAG: hypothetical protein RQ753_00340 [Desulfurivibrionaceae bacterium]|nr:hypothetical protein [Desulfobulbales bacterium]MDT8334123.1 hypothetical protein [Desulfurivibrionaceae bacterium]
MPVLSYIAIPKTGAKEELLKLFNSMQFCEAFPADNEDILILVTDTPDSEREDELQAGLKYLPGLDSLSLAFGCDDEQLQAEGDDYGVQ